jgi:capsular exopolysaccharide synthesis family protein
MNLRTIAVNAVNEPQQPETAPERSGSFELLEYWRSVAKHKWAILGLALAIALLTLLVVSSIQPTYRSTVTLLIEAGKNKIVSIDEVYAGMGGNREYFQTQAEILRSRELAEKVAARLKLATHPEFDPRQQDAPYWRKWLAAAGITPERFGFGDSAATAPAGEAAIAKAVVGKLQQRLAVQPVRLSQLIKVSFDAHDPALAAGIANSFAETFIESDLDARYQMTQKASNWLSERLGGLRKKVEASERALQQYRERERIVDAKGLAQSGAAKRLEDLSKAQIEARQRRNEAEIRYNQIRTAQGSYETLPAVANNPTMLRMRDIETDAEKKLSELSKRYGREHPRMVAAEADVRSARANTRDALRRAIQTSVATVTKEYEAARANETAVNRTLAQAKDEIQSMNRKEYQLNILEREVTSNRQLYDMFLGRFKETNAAEGMQSTIARVVDAAIPSSVPFSPNKKRAVLIAAVLGLALGIMLALLIERLDNTIKTSGEVEAKLGLPVLAALPIVSGKIKPERHFADNTHSIFSEAIRTARTGILLSAIDEPHKAIVITSSVPGEGKTTFAMNLALAFAQTKRVVLVDADMRRPSVGKVYGKESTAPGLSNLVSGTSPAQDCMFRVDQTELYVLPAGVVPPNPLELLLSKRFEETLHKLTAMFDMVIIDSPPVQLVSDAMVIARRCTGLVYVVKADDVPYQVARNGIKRIRQSLVNIIGVALNQLDFERADRYYGEYTGYAKYGYRRYYGSDGGKKRKQAA